MTESSYARSIELPHVEVFRNLKNAKRFAIDIGGSLAKLAYISSVQRKKSFVSDDEVAQNADHIYAVLEEEEHQETLHFIKFETKFIETCLDFINEHLLSSNPSFAKEKVIKATGGGAYKYKELLTSKLGVQVDKEDEMECLIKGCNFLLKNIPDESFVFQKHQDPEYKFQAADPDVFPYLLVNIGSGVSILKVEADNKYERIGGTSMGGGTFWGLGSLLTGAAGFDELLDLAAKGDHRNIDFLVKDIYGGAYSSLGLAPDLIASSFGRAARSEKDVTYNETPFKPPDLAKSLLISISNDIGQLAYLHAKKHNLKRIYFGGFFIRGHPMTMHTITYAINYWSKGVMQAMFLRHEGYLGAIGAFLKGAEEEEGAEKYSWIEDYAGSSGLQSPRSSKFPLTRKSTFDMLELHRFSNPLINCPLLLDPGSYWADTVDLTQDQTAREYWLQCFKEATDRFADRAIKSQPENPTANDRAEKFKQKYLQRLKDLQDNPCAFGSLTVRSLLDTREHWLKEFDFTDPYSQQKQFENEQALKLLRGVLSELDALSVDDRHLALAEGLLAGNVFDWGAKEVVKMMEKGNFGFREARESLQARPWLVDHFDAWTSRLQGPPHRCAIIFCDNSGMDIILGVFPFARELLRRGTKVILCANTLPALNDVTYNELNILVKRVAAISETISTALQDDSLLIMESGQASPCLDLRYISYNLSSKIKEYKADLIVLEGMGRAVHTNFDASFSCEALKIAVLKNKWLANRLGGDMFSIIFKYERSKRVLTPTNSARSALTATALPS